MFLDEAIIDVSGGNGGKGCVAWRREKYVPNGGPDGGDGGDGGNILIVADENADTLSDFASKKRFHAEHGEPGYGKNCAGANGEDVKLLVPPGTMVTLLDDNMKPVRVIADLKHHGDSVIAAKGGRGGFGNTHFKSSVRQAPDFAELGEPGYTAHVRMDLKLVADVGLIGYPSVGKSSLITAVSAARPKIAEYHFTTLIPNLGVVKVFDREFVLCDVPGLIDGASEGKGLGDKFLRHIERCGILVHILDITHDDLVADYKAIRKELDAYSPALAQKRELVVLNKTDIVNGDASVWIDQLKEAGITVAATLSAATKHGTQELMQMLLPIVLEERAKREVAGGVDEPEDEKVAILRPHLESDQMGAYRIENADDGSIIIKGRRLEQFTKMTNFDNVSSRHRFLDVMQKVGLIKALSKMLEAGPKNIYIAGIRIDEYL